MVTILYVTNGSTPAAVFGPQVGPSNQGDFPHATQIQGPPESGTQPSINLTTSTLPFGYNVSDKVSRVFGQTTMLISINYNQTTMKRVQVGPSCIWVQ